MAFFETSEQVKTILGGFFQMLADDAEMGPRLLASNLILKFNYTNPDASITVDLSGDQLALSYDDASKKPDIEMSMESEVAHHYWLGEITLPVALARRQIRAKGPIPKLMKIIPIIRNAHKMYPKHIETFQKSA